MKWFFHNIQPTPKKLDLYLLITTLLFCIFGILMVYESSNVIAFREFGDKYQFVKDQITWTVIGIVALIATTSIHYKKYTKIALPLLAINILLLIAVFLPGIGIKASGAHRWINLFSYSFQPSEITKLIVVLYLATWLSNTKTSKFRSFLLLMTVIIGLVILQPDLGTAVILVSIFMTMYFLSGAPLLHFFMLVPVLITGILVLAIISPYRLQRVLTFLNPNSDPLGASYHIRQILISLGAGGFWGLGLGASRQKYQFLPAAMTDSIFAIIGEEFGFVGALLLFAGYLFLFYRAFVITARAPDKQSFLLSGGVMSLLAFQSIINLGATVVIFPLTGVPLPFISYGGSNLVITLASIGILLNISKHGKESKIYHAK